MSRTNENILFNKVNYGYTENREVNGALVSMPVLLIRNSERFKELINVYPEFIKEYIDSGVAIGDEVRVRDDQDFFYGYNSYMDVMIGSTQLVEGITGDGRVLFRTDDNSPLSASKFSYSIRDVQKIKSK